MEKLFRFIERAKGLETKEKIKLILFFKKIKPNTEIIFKIDKENLNEKGELEEHLRQNKISYEVSLPKSYEVIKKIKNNRIIWELEGTYYVYDFFKSKKDQLNFKKYLEWLKENQLKKADKIAGKHYGYPSCCVHHFLKEKKERFLQKHYTYWEYYQKQRLLDLKYKYLSYRPCSLHCPKSCQLEKKYCLEIKNTCPKLYYQYKEKNQLKGKLVVSGISDVEVQGKSIWPEKEGYEYELVLKPLFRQHYYLISYLSRKKYSIGQILKGKVVFQYDYATVKITKEKKKVLSGLHHERKLPLLGEVVIK